jgi:HSP20 family protein
MREFARDPFQAMRELMRWDPFRSMAPFNRGERGWAPDFEVRETKDSFVFKADLPGTNKDDLDISIVGNRLQVSGKREEEEETREDTYYAYERSYGTFTRTFTLPDAADTEHISSNLKDGVLTLVVPKTTESKARKIQIGSGEKQ